MIRSTIKSLDTGHRLLVGGAVLLTTKAVLLAALLVVGAAPLAATAVLGTVAELGIGLGIVKSEVLDPAHAASVTDTTTV